MKKITLVIMILFFLLSTVGIYGQFDEQWKTQETVTSDGTLIMRYSLYTKTRGYTIHDMVVDGKSVQSVVIFNNEIGTAKDVNPLYFTYQITNGVIALGETVSMDPSATRSKANKPASGDEFRKMLYNLKGLPPEVAQQLQKANAALVQASTPKSGNRVTFKDWNYSPEPIELRKSKALAYDIIESSLEKAQGQLDLCKMNQEHVLITAKLLSSIVNGSKNITILTRISGRVNYDLSQFKSCISDGFTAINDLTEAILLFSPAGDRSAYFSESTEKALKIFRELDAIASKDFAPSLKADLTNALEIINRSPRDPSLDNKKPRGVYKTTDGKVWFITEPELPRRPTFPEM